MRQFTSGLALTFGVTSLFLTVFAARSVMRAAHDCDLLGQPGWSATPATLRARMSLAAGRLEDAKRNAGIASMLAEGKSWNAIQDVTNCSRATIAKIAKRMKAAAYRC